MKHFLILAMLLALGVGATTACVGNSGEAEQDQPDSESGSFDISNRDHAAARLTYLYEILADGNPSDPIGWAKASGAALRITEICSNFDISEDLDAACDQLLIALETPFSQLPPILAEASSELRRVMPRRKFAEYAGLVKEWDGDITDWEFDDNIFESIVLLRIAVVECQRRMSSCIDSPEGYLDFIDFRFPESHNALEVITFSATEDLSEYLEDYVKRGSGELGLELRQSDAERIFDEIVEIGVELEELDYDVSNWEIPEDIVVSLSELKVAMVECKKRSSACTDSPSGALDFIGLRLSLIREYRNDSARMTFVKTGPIHSELDEYLNRDSSGFGRQRRQRDAERIIDELDELGIR